MLHADYEQTATSQFTHTGLCDYCATSDSSLQKSLGDAVWVWSWSSPISVNWPLRCQKLLDRDSKEVNRKMWKPETNGRLWQHTRSTEKWTRGARYGMMPCCLVERCNRFRGSCELPPPSAGYNNWYPCTKPHGVTFQKIIVLTLITMRPSIPHTWSCSELDNEQHPQHHQPLLKQKMVGQRYRNMNMSGTWTKMCPVNMYLGGRGGGGQVGKERRDELYAYLQFVINALWFEIRSVTCGNAEVPPTENFVTEDVLRVSCSFNECPTIRPCHSVTSPGNV